MILYHVINLERRKDKWAWFKSHVPDFNIPFVRFDAIETKPGWKGCRDSHLSLLESCRAERVFGILEDDVLFNGDVGEAVVNAIAEMPSDWDMLSLGCSPQEPFSRYSEHLFKMGRAFCLHATIWRNRDGGAIEYILRNRDRIGKIDVFLSEEVYPKFNCFVCYPLVATQIQFESDTCGRSDVSTIEANYNKYCK